MTDGVTRLEAVRRAKEHLGEVPAAQMAAHIEATYGLVLKPAIVTVLLGTLLEHGSLDRNKARAAEQGEQAAPEKVDKRKPRRQRPADGGTQTADSLTAPKACPACEGDYTFRGRKVVEAEGTALVETKYACKACGHEWRVRVPADAVGRLGRR